jgi:hypothetical protein
MTAPSSIDPARSLHEHLASASPDLLRQMLTTFINTLMSAEADAVRGAGYGEVSPDRTNVRNGYRHRDFDTRAGTLDVAIPKLRQCSYFPDWLHRLHRSGDRAANAVLHTAVVTRMRYHEPTLRRPANGRGAVQEGHHALPETLRRPGGLYGCSGRLHRGPDNLTSVGASGCSSIVAACRARTTGQLDRQRNRGHRAAGRPSK